MPQLTPLGLLSGHSQGAQQTNLLEEMKLRLGRTGCCKREGCRERIFWRQVFRISLSIQMSGKPHNLQSTGQRIITLEGKLLWLYLTNLKSKTRKDQTINNLTVIQNKDKDSVLNKVKFTCLEHKKGLPRWRQW